ncbi:MAG: wax ester/triacylglycerol synthase domain-containing protein [Kineosporiaceae bacterium]
MFLAVQNGTVPEQLGAVLVLEPTDGFDLAAAEQTLSVRARRVPRLRQRLTGRWPGWARAVWTDDLGFRAERHIERVTCPAPGDEPALLRLASDLVVRRLPLDRPLWRATFVTGLAGGRIALVIVIQHALADGIAGLAVLDALVDSAGADGDPTTAADPAADASPATDRPRPDVRGRRRPGPVPPHRVGRAARCSLLRPTGPRRRVAVARARLDDVRAVAHAHGATVNDVLLATIAGALHATLEGRGERVPAVVVAVPVADRRTATARALGNRFREVRAALPRVDDPVEGLETVAMIMRARKRSVVGPSASRVASALVRLAVAIGLYEPYMRRQRYLHTVVTNLPGPRRQQHLCGARILEALPLAVGGGGNVTVSFAALSYAETLAVTVTADPDTVPDLHRLTAALQAGLDALTHSRVSAGSRHPRSPAARSDPSG